MASAPPALATDQQAICVFNDPSKPPVNIVARFDSRTGRQVILWKEVQTIFNDAQYVRHGERALPFLVDSSFAELLPLRIEAFPGQVLFVVLEGSSPVNSSASSTPHLASSQPSTATPAISPSSSSQSSNISGRGPPMQPFSTNNRNFATDNRADPRSNSGRNPPSQPSPVNNWNTRATDDRPDPSRRETSSSDSAAGQGESSQAPDSQTNTTASATTSSPETQEEIAQLRRPQTYVDTANVPRIQGYLTFVESLEWHETPSPRLFIVLPRTFVEDMTPSYNTFRLFWMCEYMGDSSITPHLDLHPGLDLDRPDEFFTKFGPHLLLNYQVFKYSRFNGFYEDAQQTGGLEALSDDGPHVSYDEALEFLVKSLNMPKEEIEISLDVMIDHVRMIVDELPETTRGNKSVGSYYSQTWETENLPQLTPHEFTQLRSFLFRPGMTKSGTEEVHNLYRSTDTKGHAHWLCNAHLEHVHPFIKFGQTFMRNHGTPQYNAHASQIIAETETSLAARLLYGILMSSPGFISELILKIGWKMSVEDLGHLRDVILRCRIVSLALKTAGNHLASPAHSELILLTLALGQLQSFTLENAQDVLKNVSPLSFTSPFTSLRIIRLTLDTNGQDLNAIRIRLLLMILNSPNLKVLEVEWMEMEKVFTKEAFLWELTKRSFRNLAVHLKVQDQEISVLIDRGYVRNVHLQISDLMSAGDNPHIYYGFVQSLTVRERADISDPATVATLQRILSACTTLVTLTLTCNAIDFSPAERAVRKMVKDLSLACALERLILKEPAQHNITATFSLEGNQNDPMWHHRPVQVDVTVLDHHPGLEVILINYATVIRTLNTTHAMAPLQLMFVTNVILQEERSQLESLLIALDEQWRGRDCIEQLLESCSGTLKQLTLVGSPANLGVEDMFLKILALYKGRRLILVPDRQLSRENNIAAARTQHGRTASSGQPSSEEARQRWIGKVKRAVSNDTVVIVVDDFEALCDVVPGVSANNVEWLKKR